MAQKDPLVEYKKETFLMFESLNLAVADEVTEKFFKIQLSSDSEIERQNRADEQLIYNEGNSAGGFDFSDSLSEARPSAPQQKSLNRRQRRQRSQPFKKQRIKI